MVDWIFVDISRWQNWKSGQSASGQRVLASSWCCKLHLSVTTTSSLPQNVYCFLIPLSLCIPAPNARFLFRFKQLYFGVKTQDSELRKGFCPQVRSFSLPRDGLVATVFNWTSLIGPMRLTHLALWDVQRPGNSLAVLRGGFSGQQGVRQGVHHWQILILQRQPEGLQLLRPAKRQSSVIA